MTIRNQHAVRRLRSLLSELRARRGDRGPDARSRSPPTTTPPPRRNLFNQTDVTYAAATGRIRHTLLAGAEVGRQLTDNFRNTGFFNNTATSILVPFANPTITTPVTFRQSATDADNHLRTERGARPTCRTRSSCRATCRWSAGCASIASICSITTIATATRSRRLDNLVSPRAGIVVKPVDAGVALRQLQRVVPAELRRSVLVADDDHPAGQAGEVQQLRGRREVGRRADALSLTTAVYRLDRTNTRSTDPNDPTRIVQTGSQRTNGYELGAERQPHAARGASPAATPIRMRSSPAPRRPRAAGAQVGQVPHHTFSLWNNYQVHPTAGGRARRRSTARTCSRRSTTR